MITYNGKALGTFRPFLAEVCLSKPLLRRSGKIIVVKDSVSSPIGFSGVLTNSSSFTPSSKPTVLLSNDNLASLSEGDFIVVSPSGTVSKIWDATSDSNTIFPTPACDCKCIMCPQPPQKHDEETLEFAEQLVERLDPAKVKKICVTGGEPTLMGVRFIKLMRRIKERFGHASVMVLSNGKNFSDFSLAKEFAAVGLQDCLVCISLHSDLEELNDKIAGAEGSFHKTTQGLYNLARLRQKIEIRHVVSKMNAHRLEAFAQFLFRNFPFAYHVAFMGMEVTGYAKDNIGKLWIDPFDYKLNLARSIAVLNRAAVNVSAFNIPLCLLDRKSWQFARQSISEWKNSYTPVCEDCTVKSNCCGVFTTSGETLSPNIKAITG